MSKLKTLEDLFHHHLKDLYSAEKQLMKALPNMEGEAGHSNLKKAFKDHLKETKEHVNRLEEIAKDLSIDIKGDTCEAMKGLIREAKEFISEDATSEVRDAGLIADAQRVEHYEIAAYGTVVEWARVLGKEQIAEKLEKTLNEEKEADKKLIELATNTANSKAV
jgi:ferritin-like metal-binding protein YciE